MPRPQSIAYQDVEAAQEISARGVGLVGTGLSFIGSLGGLGAQDVD